MNQLRYTPEQGEVAITAMEPLIELFNSRHLEYNDRLKQVFGSETVTPAFAIAFAVMSADHADVSDKRLLSIGTITKLVAPEIATALRMAFAIGYLQAVDDNETGVSS